VGVVTVMVMVTVMVTVVVVVTFWRGHLVVMVMVTVTVMVVVTFWQGCQPMYNRRHRCYVKMNHLHVALKEHPRCIAHHGWRKGT
jgi:low affinity Fe/Cu permease